MHFLSCTTSLPSILLSIVIVARISLTPHPSFATALRDNFHTKQDCANQFHSTQTKSNMPGQHNLEDGYETDAATPTSTKAEGTTPPCRDSHPPNNKSIREFIREVSRGYDISSPHNVPKRSDYISWNDYFMAVAYLSGQRSKDPRLSTNSNEISRGGACIVDTMGRIVGIGYAGFPRGCSDDCLPWASAEDCTEGELAWLHTRDPFLCYAEINAILNKCSNDVVGGRMFVPNFPCKSSPAFY